MNVNQLVSYSHKIAFNSSAPFEWDPSKPLGKYTAPHPSDDQIRKCCLFNEEEEIKKMEQHVDDNKDNLDDNNEIEKSKEESLKDIIAEAREFLLNESNVMEALGSDIPDEEELMKFLKSMPKGWKEGDEIILPSQTKEEISDFNNDINNNQPNANEHLTLLAPSLESIERPSTTVKIVQGKALLSLGFSDSDDEED